MAETAAKEQAEITVTSDNTLADPATVTEQKFTESVPTLPPVTEGQILTQAENSPAQASGRISSAISKAISGRQLQQHNEMATQAARERRQQLISPDLKIGEYTAPKKEVGEHQINCDKGLNSTFAFIARGFGGKITCTRRNEFQQFIDKRQYKQNDQ
ncbi:hypothetical protein GCM10011338_12400 [Alteromonas lipolytica]|nr:hypothetical protein GCM10011338_12400 [Alteromonas lipolytica]